MTSIPSVQVFLTIFKHSTYLKSLQQIAQDYRYPILKQQNYIPRNFKVLSYNMLDEQLLLLSLVQPIMVKKSKTILLPMILLLIVEALYLIWVNIRLIILTGLRSPNTNQFILLNHIQLSILIIKVGSHKSSLFNNDLSSKNLALF